VVGGFPEQRGHADKDIAFDDKGNVYVNVGLPSNACAQPDRQPGGKGQDPCPQLENGGGVWKFSADTLGQTFSVQIAMRPECGRDWRWPGTKATSTWP
jgi:glucose/arabinose dehydrogenase